VLEHRDTTFILIHFSKRYRRREISAFFDNERARQQELEAAEEPDGQTKRKPAFSNLFIWIKGLVPTQAS